MTKRVRNRLPFIVAVPPSTKRPPRDANDGERKSREARIRSERRYGSGWIDCGSVVSLTLTVKRCWPSKYVPSQSSPLQRRSVKGMPWLSLETVLVAPLNDRREIETKCALHTGPDAVRMASRSGRIDERGAAPSVEAASAKSKATRTAKGITMEF